MPFTPTTWVDGSAPGITAAQLNRIEAGIDEAHDAVAAVGTAPTYQAGWETTEVSAGSTVVVPAGIWYINFETWEMYPEVNTVSAGWLRLTKPTTSVLEAVLVISDGTDLRVRNPTGFAQDFFARQVTL